MLGDELIAVIDKDFPVLEEVTEKTLHMIDRNKHRFRGGVRVSLGRVYTNEAFEARRRRVENLRLP